MTVRWQRLFWTGTRAASAACVLGLGCLSAAQSAHPHRPGASRSEAYPDAWTAALDAREAFEAEPTGTHTHAEYAAVMDRFRELYHRRPGDPHAARAIGQVAELLAEQGREFRDRKSLRDAAGQYEFLASAYPGGSIASSALGEALLLLGPDAANDPAEARKVRRQLGAEYPHSEAAHAAAPAGHPPQPATEAEEPAAQPVVSPVAQPLAPPGASPPSSGPFAAVTAIRHWSTPTYTRVAIDLGEDVQFQAARVEHPDRIFFDLHHAHLSPQLSGRSFNVTDDGFLTRIRAAQFSGDVVRVVLDVHQVGDYSAFLLPNPSRLIIDIHAKSPDGAQAVASRPPLLPDADTSVAPPGTPPVATDARTARSSEAAGLPAMPVTDGSSGFGLPARRSAAVTRPGTAITEAVAAPRVVIPQKPTVAKPVPNTVTTHSAETGTEVAAVSDQPGKVEATSQPTSQPVVDRVSGSRSSRSRNGAPTASSREKGTPVDAAPPTADGQATLMRALGLKIGRIVIDAGHGGHDSGTLGVGGIEEKDVVLDVALRLGKLLHDRLGAEIVYTRADDTFIPLETRTAIANKAQADLFISVHANSSQDSSARGVEVYYLNFTSDPDAMRVASRENAVSTQSVHELSDLVKKITLKDKIDESRELASDVDDALYAGLERNNGSLRNRGVKKAPFVVLIGANMPSILAEISFVTNPQDASELNRPEYRERVAESLFSGVERYAEAVNGAHPHSRAPRPAAVVNAASTPGPAR